MLSTISSISHKFSTCKACNMSLRWWTLKAISSSHTLPASNFILVWCAKVTCRSSNPSTSTSSSRSCRRFLWSLLLSWLSRYHFNNIDGIKIKNIFFIHILNLFRISFVVRMVLQIVVNNIIKRSILDSSWNLFPTFDTVSFFIFDKLG